MLPCRIVSQLWLQHVYLLRIFIILLAIVEGGRAGLYCLEVLEELRLNHKCSPRSAAQRRLYHAPVCHTVHAVHAHLFDLPSRALWWGAYHLVYGS